MKIIYSLLTLLNLVVGCFLSYGTITTLIRQPNDILGQHFLYSVFIPILLPIIFLVLGLIYLSLLFKPTNYAGNFSATCDLVVMALSILAFGWLSVVAKNLELGALGLAILFILIMSLFKTVALLSGIKGFYSAYKKF